MANSEEKGTPAKAKHVRRDAKTPENTEVYIFKCLSVKKIGEYTTGIMHFILPLSSKEYNTYNLP